MAEQVSSFPIYPIHNKYPFSHYLFAENLRQTNLTKVSVNSRFANTYFYFNYNKNKGKAETLQPYNHDSYKLCDINGIKFLIKFDIDKLSKGEEGSYFSIYIQTDTFDFDPIHTHKNHFINEHINLMGIYTDTSEKEYTDIYGPFKILNYHFSYFKYNYKVSLTDTQTQQIQLNPNRRYNDYDRLSDLHVNMRSYEQNRQLTTPLLPYQEIMNTLKTQRTTGNILFFTKEHAFNNDPRYKHPTYYKDNTSQPYDFFKWLFQLDVYNRKLLERGDDYANKVNHIISLLLLNYDHNYQYLYDKFINKNANTTYKYTHPNDTITSSHLSVDDTPTTTPLQPIELNTEAEQTKPFGKPQNKPFGKKQTKSTSKLYGGENEIIPKILFDLIKSCINDEKILKQSEIIDFSIHYDYKSHNISSVLVLSNNTFVTIDLYDMNTKMIDTTKMINMNDFTIVIDEHNSSLKYNAPTVTSTDNTTQYYSVSDKTSFLPLTNTITEKIPSIKQGGKTKKNKKRKNKKIKKTKKNKK